MRSSGWTWRAPTPRWVSILARHRLQTWAAHPEWAAHVWSRCRARMLTHRGVGALHVHPDDLIAVYVDALFVSDDANTAQWPNIEKPGHLRRKSRSDGQITTPAGWAELW